MPYFIYFIPIVTDGPCLILLLLPDGGSVIMFYSLNFFIVVAESPCFFITFNFME